ncbi:MAG: peptidylprolyl isomerase [Oscillospiraceae bacterium]|nr:peptidylprolyl isomerase [Oscillospiraceae bacterium]
MLYPDAAPNTVDNFIQLCKDKFYDGLVFHRVVRDFIIQTGEAKEFPNWIIADEINNLPFDSGILAMALVVDNSQNRIANSGSTQFFITTSGSNKDALDGQYTAFGRVMTGMDVVREIGNAIVDGKHRPLKDIKIKTISLDLRTYKANEPERITGD